MKKIVFLFTFIFISVTIFSQIVIKDTNGIAYENDDTLGLPNIETFYFRNYNTSSETITYKFEVIQYILPVDAIEFDVCGGGQCSIITNQVVPYQVGNNIELANGGYEECHVSYINESSTERAFIKIKASNVNDVNDFAILSFDTDKLTGIKDVNSNNIFSIYPNPASNFIYISNLNTDNQIITIINSKGEIVKKSETNNLNEIKIDISKLENGIYVITTDNKSRKFIVKR